MFRPFLLTSPFLLFALIGQSQAADLTTHQHSTTITGSLGLNTVPSARSDEAGTIRTGIGTSDPFIHGFLGFQISDSLNVTLRQSAELSDFQDNNNQFFPGLDLKLRLLEETTGAPEIALGLQSAFGHRRTAGEYLAATKRFGDFDVTGGIGWGRYGTAAHFSNPLSIFGSHFDSSRDITGDTPNDAEDWFTGENVGLFGGIEYFTPVDGLSVKFDWGADRYSAETQLSDFEAPAPWGIGIAYSPTPWMNASLGTIGGDIVMARLSLQGNAKNWKLTDYKKDKPSLLRPFRPKDGHHERAMQSANSDHIFVYDIQRNGSALDTKLEIKPHHPLPRQIGRMLRHLVSESEPEIEKINIKPSYQGLKGPIISLMRADFERAGALKNGSPEEIWRNADIKSQKVSATRLQNIVPGSLFRQRNELENFKITLQNQSSLAEDDFAGLTRTSLIADYRSPQFFGLLLVGTAWRVNIHDNLNQLSRERPPSLANIRSDIDDFTDSIIAPDSLYTHFGTSFGSNWHLGLTTGYLEEQFGGTGIELLYRPYGKRYAFGAEGWAIQKRDPNETLNLGFDGRAGGTGHISAWYEMPEHNLTARLRAGQYLAGDVGGDFTLTHRFKNGAELEGFAVVTNTADLDRFGGTSNLQSGVRISMPLGSLKYVPEQTRAEVLFRPFGRDAGESLNKPIDLYEQTQAFSAGHIGRHWGSILD